MRLLLGSGGFRTEERTRLLVEQMRTFFGRVEKVLFIPYALQDHDEYISKMLERGLNAGYALDSIHRHADPQAAIRQAQALFVGGGNTIRLLKELYRHDLIGLIRERVRNGTPYLGVSAGTNVACPTIKTTNDMPIVLPPSLDALALVPFQVNAHYFTGSTYYQQDDAYHLHYGETRDDRIFQFHEENDTPVVGLWEGGLLRIEDAEISLLGTPARIFRKGQEPVDVQPGTRLKSLLPLESKQIEPQAPISYTVAATFPNASLAEEWLRWLKSGHIAEVLAGGATAAAIIEMDGQPHAFEVHYLFPSREAFTRYERDHAPRLRAEGLQRFPVEKGITYRRSVGKVLNFRDG
jgi:dipeptidase E